MKKLLRLCWVSYIILAQLMKPILSNKEIMQKYYFFIFSWLLTAFFIFSYFYIIIYISAFVFSTQFQPSQMKLVWLLILLLSVIAVFVFPPYGFIGLFAIHLICIEMKKTIRNTSFKI
ncbi:MAG: hypothetical protein AB1454_00115 [Candidatus Auribacterota bacterium]